MNTAELLARLQRHYIKPGENLPGGVFIPECGWNGQGGWRRCDALYIGFTSSSGRILIGHELKVSRADWICELNKPDKADQWADESHEWWLVVGDRAIVRDGELPAGWGLMAPGRSKTRMDVITKADRKPSDHRPSWHAVRSILARQDTLRAQAISDIKLTAADAARKDNEQRIQAAIDASMRQTDPGGAQARERLQAIETALGGRIDWDAERRGYIRGGRDWIGLAELKLVADAVRATGDVKAAIESLTGRYSNPVARTRQALDDLEQGLSQLKEAAR